MCLRHEDTAELTPLVETKNYFGEADTVRMETVSRSHLGHRKLEADQEEVEARMEVKASPEVEGESSWVCKMTFRAIQGWRKRDSSEVKN